MSSPKPITTLKLRQMKAAAEKITMITAYDYPGARLADEAGVEMILVGDTLGMVVLGYENTLAVTMEDMLHHTKAVTRGTRQAFVVADMPFLSYQVSEVEAIRNAGRFLKEAGAQAVKLEGGSEIAPVLTKITSAGIPVIGHIGFTPQSIHQIGGAIYQGKTAHQAVQLVEDALRLEDAGISGLVLELVPWEVAEQITARVTIPTIGIGSGPACDGQVLVYHDLLGMNFSFYPRHNKIYAEVGELARQGIQNYIQEVKQGVFPTESNTRRMESAEIEAFSNKLNGVIK